MKHLIALLALTAMNVVAVSAQDVMKITFKDASTANYPVETIEDITFEDNIPGDPSFFTIKPIKINDDVYTYDELGRCTSISGGGLSLELNYTSMKVTMNGTEIGNFSLTQDGYFEDLNFSFMGSSESQHFEYDNEGHCTARVILRPYGEDKGQQISEFIWEAGLLKEINIRENFLDSGSSQGTSEVLVYEYSDIPNSLGQYTLAMSDMAYHNNFAVTGLMGKAPILFPMQLQWRGDFAKSISYTFNSDGSVNTETIGGISYNYSYATTQATSELLPHIYKKLLNNLHSISK